MAEIRLVFDSDGDADVRRVQPIYEPTSDESLDGQAVPLTFDLDTDQQKDLQWCLEEYMDLPDHGAQVRARRVEQDISRWGRELFANTFGAGTNAGLLKRLLREKGNGPPHLTVATDDAHVLRLPWELLADEFAQHLVLHGSNRLPQFGQRDLVIWAPQNLGLHVQRTSRVRSA